MRIRVNTSRAVQSCLTFGTAFQRVRQLGLRLAALIAGLVGHVELINSKILTDMGRRCRSTGVYLH